MSAPFDQPDNEITDRQNLGNQRTFRTREVFFTLLTAAITLRFVFNFGSDLIQSPNLFTVLFLIKASLDLGFTLFRRLPNRIPDSLRVWFIGISRGLTTMLFSTVPNLLFPQVGGVLLILGLTLQIICMFSIGRSFGIVPAEREIKTKGAYKFIRHPLYFSYLISYVGFTVAQFSPWNLFVCGIFIISVTLSIREEERLLLHNPTYRNYTASVRWRLFPGLF